jgi:hypothetical protein
MIASLLKRTDGTYYCSNCMMRQRYLRPTCYFCEYEFSNYMSELTKNYEDKRLYNEEEIEESQWRE